MRSEPAVYFVGTGAQPADPEDFLLTDAFNVHPPFAAGEQTPPRPNTPAPAPDTPMNDPPAPFVKTGPPKPPPCSLEHAFLCLAQLGTELEKDKLL